ncbi:TRAP transporter large permease [Haloplanus halobius]|uniref:TRAP transporter large permease n=1 Tax=Haloplanus halobius TaxID=2934938 RepID=UPI00200CE7EF|nr:TRAP transporter large permease [Haloplanus sp. XH21]
MNEILLITAVFLGGLFLLYGLGVPVGFAMVIAGIFSWIAFDSVNYAVISNQMLFGLDSFPLLAIPFYVFLGRLMNSMGMTKRIFRFASALVGQFRGGIAYINIVASMFFAGMSGLATADVAGLGRIEYTAMRDYGYDKSTAIGVTGMSSLIGPIIPPSVPIIIYALLAEESIGSLFLAGVVPGILLGLCLMLFVFILSYFRGFEAGEPFELREAWESFKGAFLALITPLLIIGGILLGYFTATEAGAIAVVYTVLVGMFVYQEITVRSLLREARDSMIETCALTFLLAAATFYGLVALQLRIPIVLTESILGVSSDPLIVMFLLVGLFLLVGTFMGATAAITILTPILIGLVETVGIDTVHFGIVMVLTLLLGTLTPPFGTILFVLEKVTDAELEEIMKAVVPFYIPMVVVILLIIFFPEIATFLPRQLLG